MSATLPVLDAVTALLADLFPEALASFGPPGMDLPNDVAAVTGFRIVNTTPTAGGPRRSVEEELQVEVVLSCYEPGGTESARPVTSRSLDMLTALQDALRDRSTATLGGSCREAHVTDVDGSALALKVPDPSTGQVLGRNTDLTVTITCKTRI